MIEDLKTVTFTFKCHEKESADLKVRLKYDKLQQTEFFVSILNMYIENDPLLLSVVEKIKNDKGKMGKKKLKNTRKDLDLGREIMNNLGITESDKQNVFDLIESDWSEHE